MELRLEALLRLAWAAGTLPIIVAYLPLPCVRRFFGLLSGFCNRGKTSLSSSQKFTVPQRYFLHFYVVAVFCTTCLLVSTWFYAYRKMVPLGSESLHYLTTASHVMGGSHMFSIHKNHLSIFEPRSWVWRTIFVLLLMEIQVLRRLYETLNVFNYSPSARMHIFGYLTGLFFYTAAPLSLASSVVPEALNYTGSQLAEFIVKGQAGMPEIDFIWWGSVKPLLRLGWCQCIGAAIFLWGWIHQRRCHAILGSLRKHAGADEYFVPHGDWFEKVSCPHYLAEIIIYAGILVASGGLDVTVWLLFAFVVANLVFAAATTHRWYCYKFDNYPPSRYAIIPLIY